MTLSITKLDSKYTTKPGYSQREIGGLPTAASLVTGAPNLAATWLMVIPRFGVATSESFTAMPLSTATVAAPARPPANTAVSSKLLYPMANLIGYTLNTMLTRASETIAPPREGNS